MGRLTFDKCVMCSREARLPTDLTLYLYTVLPRVLYCTVLHDRVQYAHISIVRIVPAARRAGETVNTDRRPAVQWSSRCARLLDQSSAGGFPDGPEEVVVKEGL